MAVALPSHFESRLRLYGIEARCCEVLHRLWPVLKPALHEGIHRFIEAEKVMPSVDKIFAQHADWIGKVEIAHFHFVLSGRFGADYVESCVVLSEAERKIGLTSRTRMIAGTMIVQTAIDALAQHYRFSPRKLAEACKIVSRAVSFDIATTMTYYQDGALAQSEARRKQIETAIAEFEGTISETIKAVKTVSQSLSAGSTQMGDAAEHTSQRMRSAAVASGATTEVVETTAAATEELSQSIAEIGSQTSDGLSLANGAAESARVSTERLAALTDDRATLKMDGQGPISTPVPIRPQNPRIVSRQCGSSATTYSSTTTATISAASHGSSTVAKPSTAVAMRVARPRKSRMA